MKELKRTNLEVQSSLVCQISLVPRQGYYNIRTGLSLKLFNPILGSYKGLLPNRAEVRGGRFQGNDDSRLFQSNEAMRP